MNDEAKPTRYDTYYSDEAYHNLPVADNDLPTNFTSP